MHAHVAGCVVRWTINPKTTQPATFFGDSRCGFVASSVAASRSPIAGDISSPQNRSCNTIYISCTNCAARTFPPRRRKTPPKSKWQKESSFCHSQPSLMTPDQRTSLRYPYLMVPNAVTGHALISSLPTTMSSLIHPRAVLRLSRLVER